MKKKWPLAIDTIEWNYETRYFSRGHHDPQAFCAAVKAADGYLNIEPSDVVYEWWRFAYDLHGDYDLRVYPTKTPGRGAVPITAERSFPLTLARLPYPLNEVARVEVEE